MRDGRYAAAVADRADLAIEKARAALKEADSHEPDQTNELLAAVRDIVGWNTIWDETNNRPYTAVTRIWNLGKFAVWYNDQTYAALLSGLLDMDVAREELGCGVCGINAPQGNAACIVTSNDGGSTGPNRHSDHSSSGTCTNKAANVRLSKQTTAFLSALIDGGGQTAIRRGAEWFPAAPRM